MEITSRHISFDKLADLAENRLQADERDAALTHVKGCQRCGRQLAELEHLFGLMRTDDSVDAPRDVIASAVSLFDARAATRKPFLLRRLVAALSFDSQQLSPAFGVRSGQTATARQLLYNAGELDIDLRITQSGEEWTVSGQVLGECEGGEAFLQGAKGYVTAPLNELCEFTLPAVSDGSYILKLRFYDVEVEVPDIELRA